MPVEISTRLRRLVRKRAGNRCEYCLLPQEAVFQKHEPDHIISLQHGGKTEASNLALACLRCNRYKGPNVGSFDSETGKLVPLFNPRIQKWEDHFQIQGVKIKPKTPEARVTIRLLRLNDENRIAERRLLI